MKYVKGNNSVLEFKRHRFGVQLAFVRKTLGLKQRDASAQSGISTLTISRVERGLPVSGDTLACLALWADMDLREYVEVKDCNPKQGNLI